MRAAASSTIVRGDSGLTGWSNATATSEPRASWTAIACSAVKRRIEVAAKRHAVVVDDTQVAERDDLEAAGVGEDRAIPSHEPVETTQGGDPLVAGPE